MKQRTETPSLRTLDALDVCLAAFQTGVPLERTVSLYPEEAETLRAPLDGAVLAQALCVDAPSAESFHRSRTRLLGHAARLRKSQKAPWFRGFLRLSWALALVLALFFFSGYSVYSAAAQALPGESLYPVKRMLENARLQMTSPARRPALEAVYNQRRLDEVQALIHKRSGGHYVTFWGTVEEQSDTRWVVNSIPVQLGTDVRIIGDIKVGMVIEIEGKTTPEGWILASELHLNRRDVVGNVEHISPTEWTVNGVTFKVNQNTTYDGQPALGDPVLATLQAEEDGSLLAMHIIRLVPLDPTQTPKVTPTPLPTYTPTPQGPASRRFDTPAVRAESIVQAAPVPVLHVEAQPQPAHSSEQHVNAPTDENYDGAAHHAKHDKHHDRHDAGDEHQEEHEENG